MREAAARRDACVKSGHPGRREAPVSDQRRCVARFAYTSLLSRDRPLPANRRPEFHDLIRIE
jgi:hypothetical protein